MKDDVTTISDIRKVINAFRQKRGWTNEDPKDVALSLMLESAELLEHFQWLSGEKVSKHPKIKQAVGEEMSDVLWWLVTLSQRLEIDISHAFAQKLKKNDQKYPEKLFSPKVNEKERLRTYYRIKAETRGGHPLYDPDEK